MVELKNNIIASNNDIVMDADGLADKQKIMNEHRANAKLYSTAETFQFLAAALLPVGLATLIATAKGISTAGAVAATGAAEAITLGSIGAAFATAPVMILLGAAALCTAVAIGSRYMASKHFHNANLNSTEMNSKHTARYIAKELKAQAACVQSEYPENSRADGKRWAQVVEEKSNILSLARH